MLMRPLVSVIVPVYKVEPYLPKCLDSIVNQTYRHLEIILVDDGSPDHCGEICDAYAKTDARIKVFHTENKGLCAARNYGIAKAKGLYIGFVDSDDWIESDMYETLVNEIEKHKADIVNCGVYDEYPTRTVITSATDRMFDNSKDLIKALFTVDIGNGIWHKLFRKSCFTNIVFPKGHVYEDIIMTYRLFYNATKVVCISKPLYHYRKKRTGAITTSHSMENLRDYWLAHRLRYDFILADRQLQNDTELINVLLSYCAAAIVRTWRWYYPLSEKEKKTLHPFIKEMQYFSKQHIPVFGMKHWPIHLRLSIFLTRFDNTIVYALLNKICVLLYKMYCLFKK